MSNPAAANPKDILLNEIRTEYETTQKRLKELGSLIDQSQAEVRRLQQRNVDVTTQVSRIEQNLDSVPRADIKVTYNAALDTRARLLTVQSQLEKFQQDRTNLERFSNLFQTFMKMLEGVPSSAVTALPKTGPINTSDGGLSRDTIVRLVQSQEADRQRLAKHMHDGPAQSLTNFILQAEICRRLFDRNPDRAGEELDNLKTAASATFQRVRDYIFELRPMMLDDLGLIPTMKRYVSVFEEKTGIETRITIVGEERRRPEQHVEVVLFRSMQELLNYCRDVAASTKIDLTLDTSGSPAKVTLNFNGKTIEESELSLEHSKNKSQSLNNIVERVELVGGNVELTSIEGEGNRVEILLPIGEPA